MRARRPRQTRSQCRSRPKRARQRLEHRTCDRDSPASRASAPLGSTPTSRNTDDSAMQPTPRCSRSAAGGPAPFNKSFARSNRVRGSRPASLQQILRIAARLGKLVRFQIERAPHAAVGRRRGGQRVCVRIPWDRSSTARDLGHRKRPKRRCAQRERTVGSSMSGRDVTRMNTDAGSGSSSVLSSAFCAADHERVGLFDDRHTPAAFERAERPRGRSPPRTCSILIDPVSPGSISSRRDARHGRCGGMQRTRRTHRARTIAVAHRAVQFSACATATAVSRLPTPSGPDKIRLGVSDSREMALREQAQQRAMTDNLPKRHRRRMVSRRRLCDSGLDSGLWALDSELWLLDSGLPKASWRAGSISCDSDATCAIGDRASRRAGDP